MSSSVIETRLTVGGDEVLVRETIAADGDLPSISQVIADSSTNLEIAWQADVSQIKSIVIASDQAITIKTNSTGAPDNTLNIVAGMPYVWRTGDYNALLLTADVTKLFVTNASGSSATLKIRGNYDPTP